MRTHHTFVDFLIRSVMAILLGIGLALLLNTKVVAGDVHLDVIKTKTDVYKNVTVTGHNDTDIFIVHSQGMANVKIKDLDPETLWRVGLGEKPLEPGSPEALAAAAEATNHSAMPAALAKMLNSAKGAAIDEEMKQKIATFAADHPVPVSIDQVDPRMLIIAGAILLAFHLFFSFCLKLIVEKTGKKPGVLVWLPFFQVFPMLRAAGMSGWWVLALLIPVVNIFVQIVWCVKIARARGKGPLTAIFLILPVINLLAFLYLAFSSAEQQEHYDSDRSKIVIPSTFSEA